MFSRTTIASSISRPMASESAISVSVFSVMPRKYMTMNDEMTEMGSVRPVMTVDRQEFRKQKTMSDRQQAAEDAACSCTSATDSRMNVDVSRTTWISTPGGSSFCSVVDRRQDRVDDADRVGLGLLRDVDGHGRLAVDERERALLLDACPRPSRRRRA